MVWFSRLTRFGDVHWVYGQERNISCGVASVVMAVFKIHKLTPGIKAVYSEDEILKRARQITGEANPLGNSGLDGVKMLKLLNDATYKMAGWTFASLPSRAVPSKIIKTVGVTKGIGPVVSVKPMIAMINWHGGGGNHWVLFDTVREFGGTLYATVCDPWDANVHFLKLEKGKGPEYTAKEEYAKDIWGAPKRKQYSETNKGNLRLGIVISRLASCQRTLISSLWRIPPGQEAGGTGGHSRSFNLLT